jgi:hypothetical protein
MTNEGDWSVGYVRERVMEAKSQIRLLDTEMLEKYKVLEALQIDNIRLEKENAELKKVNFNGDDVSFARLDTSTDDSAVIERCRGDYLNILSIHSVRKKLLKGLKLKMRVYKDKIDTIARDFQQYFGLKQILSEELSKENKPNQSVIDLKRELFEKDKQIAKLTEEYDKLDDEYIQKEKEYNYLSMKKSELNFQLKILEDRVASYDSNTIDEHFKAIQHRLKKNKKIYEKVESELNYSLYFIRFSNSLVRSFFNIINVRRIQIKMFEKGSKESISNYNFLFKKLDELELSLIGEYKEYLALTA